jgi:hypothetical protein
MKNKAREEQKQTPWCHVIRLNKQIRSLILYDVDYGYERSIRYVNEKNINKV